MKTNILKKFKFLRKVIVFGTFIIVFIPTLIILTNFSSFKIKAGWIDPEWQYRSRILISSHSVNQDNVYITLPTFNATDANRYQGDCGDLRFTKLTGELLQYFVVDCDSTANIHVKFDTLPIGSTSFYMYYGNSSAVNGFEIADFSTAATGLGTISFYSGEEFRSKPIAHWKLDENTGQTVVDSIGGFNGTLGANGSVNTDDPTWATGVDCLKESCLQFDGSNDYIDAGSPSAFLFGNSDFGITMWVNPQPNSTSQRLMERTNVSASNGQWSFYLQNDGRIAFVSQNVQIINSNCSITYNRWNMVGFSRTGTTYDFFLNGRMCSSHTVTSVNFNTTVPLRIGGNAIASVNNTVNGKLDDIKLFNRTFTEKEFEDNYNFILGINYLNTNFIGHESRANNPNPIRYYKFDEQGGQIANNSITANNSATIGLDASISSNDPTWQSSSNCRINGCLSFDGNDSVLTDLTSAIGTSPITVSGWFKSPDISQSGMIFSKRLIVTPFTQMSLMIGSLCNGDAGQFLIVLDLPARCSIVPVDVADNQWHHFVYVRTSTSITLYLDGKLQVNNSSATVSNLTNTDNFLIGDGNTHARFTGLIDEIKIWDVALTENQAFLDYNANSSLNVSVTANTEAANLVGGPGNAPISEWKFDENHGSTAKDTSINSNDLTLNSDTKWVPGKVGSALQFDGIDDNATAPNATQLNIGTSDFTIEAWVKGNNLTDSDIIMGKTIGGSCSSSYGYSLGVFDGLKPTLHFCTTTGSHAKIQSDQSLTNNEWYHIAVLVDRDSTTNTKMYINGILVTTTLSNLTSHTGSITNTEVFAIGSESDNGFNWDGQIDQIRIYNYLRTASQRAHNYNGGEPIGWWKLDETTGTTARDYTKWGNHGTLIDMTPASDWLNGSNCRLNGCLDFDGVNDYATVPASATLQPTDSISVSAWYRTSSTAVQGIVMKRYAESAAPFNSYGLNIANGGFPAFAVSTSLTQTVVSGSRNISDGRWHHLVGVYDGSQARIYVDGLLAASTSLTGSIIYTNLSLRFGAAILPFSPPERQILIGRLDEVKIFNYALDAIAVKTDFNLGSALRYE